MASDEPQAPGAGPEEGIEFFHNARRNLHRRRKAGKVGWIYVFFWYLYHVMTFWTIPNRLVVWENAKMRRLSQKTLPESMEKWSQPLPEIEWAQPSDELKKLSAQVTQRLKDNPAQSVTAIYAELYAQQERLRA